MPEVGDRHVAEICKCTEALADHPDIARIVWEFEQPFLRELSCPPVRVVSLRFPPWSSTPDHLLPGTISRYSIKPTASIVVIAMIREAPAMTVRQNLGELLNEIQYRGDSVVITKSGKPVAALIDIALFERLRTLDVENGRLRRDLANGFAGLPDGEGLSLIDEAVRATRGLGS